MISVVFIILYGVAPMLTSREPEDRIVGGQPTFIHAHPYQLAFLFQNNFICGAVLISKDTAITAAHCVQFYSPDGSGYSVRAGSSFFDIGGIKMDVKKAIPHPKYANFDYDIAVLRLKESLPLSRRIQPIAISNIGGDNLAGKIVEVSGWGITIPFIPQSISLVLRETALTIVKKSVCKQVTGFEFLTDRMICAKGVMPFSDSCQGDSGSPLVWKNTLIGLVSFGRGCSSGIPGVYTDVTKFPDFIEENIKKRIIQ